MGAIVVGCNDFSVLDESGAMVDEDGGNDDGGDDDDDMVDVWSMRVA
jgi:hypothetical protein